MGTEVQPNIHQNDCSEEPPSYFSITQPGIQLAPTITVNPYSTQPNSEVTLPPYNYNGSMAAGTVQPTIQPTSVVTVVTSQPSFNDGHSSSFTQRTSGIAEQLLGASVFLSILCGLCGSPLTLICFVPAIYLSRKVLLYSHLLKISSSYISLLIIHTCYSLWQVKDYGEHGESVKVLKATSSVVALLVIGVLSGLVIIIGSVVTLKLFVY